MNRSRFALALPLVAFSVGALASTHAAPATLPSVSAQMMDHGQSVNGKPLASPAAMAEVKLHGKSIIIHYNAPSVRGRAVMGNVVPYGKVWRTGANPATSFTSETDLTIGTLHVPAGKYTLYTLPAAPGTPWMLIVNKQTGQWGTEYSEAQDLGRTPMHAEKLSTPQEVMSIAFEKTTGNSTQLHVKWETIDEWVEMKAAK